MSPLELAHCSQQPCGMEVTRERARDTGWGVSRTVSRMWVCVVGIHGVCVEFDLVSPVKLLATPTPFTEGSSDPKARGLISFRCQVTGGRASAKPNFLTTGEMRAPSLPSK